jgi:hypothetical protein
MIRLLLTVLLALCFFPSLSSAVDIKNIHKCYGPLGAKRDDNKCLPGDIFYMEYDIENLALDKTGKASLTTTLEFIDPQKNVIFKKDIPKDVVPQLGGARIPGDAFVSLGPKQAPGKYTIRVTVHDKIAKQAKAFEQAIDVGEPAFGFVGAMSRSVAIVGDPAGHVTTFGLVNFKLDEKTKLPKATMKIRILDEAGKDVTPATDYDFPPLPDDADLEKGNFVPIAFPIFLNRSGRFTIDVQAEDKNGKKTAKLSFPLTVLDAGSFTGK